MARKEEYQVEMSRRSWVHAGRSSVGRENSLWRVEWILQEGCGL